MGILPRASPTPVWQTPGRRSQPRAQSAQRNLRSSRRRRKDSDSDIDDDYMPGSAGYATRSSARIRSSRTPRRSYKETYSEFLDEPPTQPSAEPSGQHIIYEQVRLFSMECIAP